ncbi:transcriptional repressor LexA [Thermodesulforhabdus norvegica]|uniref:LexA repressor n=1 Tax=Thermodesulforhabdus norvegica TaxID=39841 RepID=A0A1I4VD84_9BACT|nr:transcriptional repressor LexA [Thermodesulforhabdus norvegica]SFM99164.1 repressor LexA [Thermodesulforhabdus norvegica]
MKKLTRKQTEVLNFLIQYQKDHGFPPTIQEIMEKFGFSSPRTAASHLDSLEKKGAIRISRGKARGIEILTAPFGGVPLVGKIPAGFPEEAIEDFREVIPIDPGFFGSGVKFAVRVKGDSMEGAGIRDGDIVIIRQQSSAENGQIVAAIVDGEVTLKRIKKYPDGRVELRPENPSYRPLVFRHPQSPQIVGIMVGLIRKSSI